MRFTFLTTLALGLALALAAAAAHAEPLDRIIAVVNDGVVLQSELDRALAMSRRQLSERGIRPPPGLQHGVGRITGAPL